MPISEEQKRFLLSSEVNAGISFSNILLAFGTAALGLLFASANISEHPAAVGLAVMLVFSGLYASICYANTFGILRDDESTIADCMRPIVWGNALSEYGGVYVIVLLVPVMSTVFTSNLEVLYIVTFFVISLFISYHCTRFDLLPRAIPSAIGRIFVALLFCAVIVASTYCTVVGMDRLSDFLVLMNCMICLALCATHIFVGEAGAETIDADTVSDGSEISK